jgi:hypothetical protein
MFWPERSLLCVGDLHLGRAERLAREGGDLLPSYESIATLDRLEAEIAALSPRLVICLGDSFDDLAAARTLSEAVPTRIGRLAAGRRWIWVAGDHDPGPVELPGTHLAELRLGLLSFRHIALPRLAASGGEVSAHYHPKARVTRRAAGRSCPPSAPLPKGWTPATGPSKPCWIRGPRHSCWASASQWSPANGSVDGQASGTARPQFRCARARFLRPAELHGRTS